MSSSWTVYRLNSIFFSNSVQYLHSVRYLYSYLIFHCTLTLFLLCSLNLKTQCRVCFTGGKFDATRRSSNYINGVNDDVYYDVIWS